MSKVKKAAGKPLPDLRVEWNKTAAEWLQGRTIVSARYTTAEEAAKQGLGCSGITFKLDDGTEVDVMCDDEGNAPGALHMYKSDGKHEILPVIS